MGPMQFGLMGGVHATAVALKKHTKDIIHNFSRGIILTWLIMGD